MPHLIRAYSAGLGELFPGALPQAEYDAAPLALNRYALRGRFRQNSLKDFGPLLNYARSIEASRERSGISVIKRNIITRAGNVPGDNAPVY